MFIAVKTPFPFKGLLFEVGVIYLVRHKSSESFEVQNMNGSSVILPSTFHDNFLALTEIIWGLERFSLSGIPLETMNKLLLSTTSVEIIDGVKRSSIEGDLVVSFSGDGNMSVRKYSNNKVEISKYEVNKHVRFADYTEVFYKESFHPFTLDSTEMTEKPEKPETALVAASVERECLPCCIQ